MAALFGCSWCVIGSLSALGCEPRDPTPQGRGARIFQRTCAACHGPTGKGTLRPGMSQPPRDLTQADFQLHRTNADLRQSIRVGKGQMPAFGGLMGEEEIADLIAFIRTLAPPGTLLPGVPGTLPPGSLAPGVVGTPSGVLAQPSAAPLASPPTAQGSPPP